MKLSFFHLIKCFQKWFYARSVVKVSTQRLVIRIIVSLNMKEIHIIAIFVKRDTFFHIQLNIV